MPKRLKTYTAGSDASAGYSVPYGITVESIGNDLATKVDGWFASFDESKCDEIKSELETIKVNLKSCGAPDDVIKGIEDAIDDLNSQTVKDLARYPLEQVVSKILNPEPVVTERASIKEPDLEEQSVAKYLPEDVVMLPSINSLGIVKSWIKVGDDYVYDIELINGDRLPVGKAMAEESTLEPRSKSAVKHAAMKLTSTMEMFVAKISELVDQIDSSEPVGDEAIDFVIRTADDLLKDKSLEKKYFRAMQTAQYSLSAAKRILETTGDENLYNDAILKAYGYANKVLEDLPNSGQPDFRDSGMKAVKSLLKMVAIGHPDTEALSKVVLSLRVYKTDPSIKSLPSLSIALTQLKKAMKSAALNQEKRSIAEISTAIQALKVLTE